MIGRKEDKQSRKSKPLFEKDDQASQKENSFVEFFKIVYLAQREKREVIIFGIEKDLISKWQNALNIKYDLKYQDKALLETSKRKKYNPKPTGGHYIESLVQNTIPHKLSIIEEKSEEDQKFDMVRPVKSSSRSKRPLSEEISINMRGVNSVPKGREEMLSEGYGPQSFKGFQ